MIGSMARLTITLTGKVKAVIFVVFLVVILLIPHFLYRRMPPPSGSSISSLPLPVLSGDIRLLVDFTAFDSARETRVMRQTIFDEILSMVRRADRFIYIDFFLWNPWKGSVPENHRALSAELSRALIEKKRLRPDMDIIVLTDPINRIYGRHEPAYFTRMAEAGIPVVFTDLDRMPDSNPFYAAYWSFADRFILGLPLLNSLSHRPFFDNPFESGGPDISLRQFGRMLLFKANHRKVVITGSGEGSFEMLVGSLNPADGSSAHSNMALFIRGPVAVEALRSELGLVLWSADRPDGVLGGMTSQTHRTISNIQGAALVRKREFAGGPSSSSVQWMTEEAIADKLVAILGAAEAGDEIRIAMFYLADREIVRAVKLAALNGARVRLILDANRDAFGMKKIGIPNRQVAAELMKLSGRADVGVRWADTHGEQFHTKAISITNRSSGRNILMTGSANWTRRNLRNLNLEANLFLESAPDAVRRFNDYFDRAWANKDGLSHTLPYGVWREKGWTLWWKTLLYRFQEWSGMCTF